LSASPLLQLIRVTNSPGLSYLISIDDIATRLIWQNNMCVPSCTARDEIT